MVAFSKTELDSERLPALQERIRSAQEEALQQIGTAWPADAKRVEQDFDALNGEHLTFIRSAIKAPQITTQDALDKHGGSTNRLLQQSVLGCVVSFIVIAIWRPEWSISPWLLGLALLAASYPFFMTALQFSKALRTEMPWIQASASNAQFLNDARQGTGVLIWFTIIPAVFTLFTPITLYINGHVVEIALTAIYVLGSILLLLLGISIGLFIWVFSVFKRTVRHQLRSESQSRSLRLDAMENPLKGIKTYEWESQRRNIRLANKTRQTIKATTALIADELVAEYTISPVLAQRLKDASWWESRILYTTPELSSKAVVPTPSQLVTLAARI